MQLVVMCKLFSYDVICKQSTSHISQAKDRHTCYQDEFRLMLGPMNCIWVTGRWRLAQKKNKKTKNKAKRTKYDNRSFVYIICGQTIVV